MTDRTHRDRGSTTIAILVAMLIVTIVAIQVANVLVYQFGRAAVRQALDEGTRLGARATSGSEIVECEQLANAAVAQFAGGLGDGITITCATTGPTLTATADVHFDAWLADIADYDATMTASAALVNNR